MEVLINFDKKIIKIRNNIIRAESTAELISYIIPDDFNHKDFVDLEKNFLQNKISGLDVWLSITDYMRNNELKTRKSVYDRIKKGTLLSKKVSGFTYVKDKDS